MTRRTRLGPLATLVGLAVTGCLGETTGPGGTPSGGTEIILLNRGSRTIEQFSTDGQTLATAGSTVSLPSNFDGNAIDVSLDLFVTTSNGGGTSQVIWGSLDTGNMVTTGFPSGAFPDAAKPTLVLSVGGNVGALVPARGRNAIYLSFPGQQTATLLAGDVGEYVQRALPFGDLVIAVDANLDDVGGSLDPLGPARLEYVDFLTGTFFDELDITGTVDAVDISFLIDRIALLGAGSLDDQMLPVGDGSLALINALGRGLQSVMTLEGNGVAIEGGRDGLAYVTRTTGAGTLDTDVLSFSFSTAAFARGPANPIKPKNSDGSDLTTCRVTTALTNGRLLCATFDPAAPSAPGRLVLMQADGTFIDDIAIGAGVVDIALR